MPGLHGYTAIHAATPTATRQSTRPHGLPHGYTAAARLVTRLVTRPQTILCGFDLSLVWLRGDPRGRPLGKITSGEITGGDFANPAEKSEDPREPRQLFSRAACTCVRAHTTNPHQGSRPFAKNHDVIVFAKNIS